MAQLAPDDDPRFAAWIRDVGALQEVPPEPVREPSSAVLAAAALIAATIGMGTAIGIALALVMAAVSIAVAVVLMIAGTVVALVSLTYLVVRAT